MEHKSNKATITIIAVVVVVLLVAGIGYAISQSNTSPEPEVTDSQRNSAAQETAEDAPATTNETDSPASSEQAATTIVFTDNGFSPASYTAKKGSMITVKNTSSMDVQFSSDNHPAHTKQSELNLRTLRPGESETFTVTKTGTWGFHDHINEQYTGTLVVTE